MIIFILQYKRTFGSQHANSSTKTKNLHIFVWYKTSLTIRLLILFENKNSFIFTSTSLL